MLTRESAIRKDRATAHATELQHRHFAFIAATIACYAPWGVSGARAVKDERRNLAIQFANACGTTNARFDRARFLRACGVDETQ